MQINYYHSPAEKLRRVCKAAGLDGVPAGVQSRVDAYRVITNMPKGHDANIDSGDDRPTNPNTSGRHIRGVYSPDCELSYLTLARLVADETGGDWLAINRQVEQELA